MSTGTPLQLLEQQCNGCYNCPLGAGRQNVVFSRGNPGSRVVVIGEAPGADEDIQGKPFTGVSGQLLDQMFKHIGLDTNTDLYLTNTLKCRPPNNRPPEDDELLQCMPWLEQQLALVNPRFIVAVGNSALKWLSGKPGITARRGKWSKYKHIPYIAVFHPSYLLRMRHTKHEPASCWRYMRADLEVIKDAYQHNVFNNAGAPI